MLKTIYHPYTYQWVLDENALSPSEREDLYTIRNAIGSYGPNTKVRQSMERLGAQGLKINMRLDGAPVLYLDGTLI